LIETPVAYTIRCDFLYRINDNTNTNITPNVKKSTSQLINTAEP